MRRVMAFMLLAILALPLATSAQEAKHDSKHETKAPANEPKRELPPGWKVRLDRAGNTEDVRFWSMPPGWHTTTGPAAIIYNLENTAKGQYRLESESFLFDPGTRNEAYGFFFGGNNLDKDNQSYTYFLIRRDGKFLIKQRDGAETREITPWTENAAIVKHEGGEKTAKNVLAIEAGASMVDFFVNGQKVASLEKSKVSTDGVVGLRINHSINVHVTSLMVTPKK
jgi:hypothetical protein